MLVWPDPGMLFEVVSVRVSNSPNRCRVLRTLGPFRFMLHAVGYVSFDVHLTNVDAVWIHS